MDSMTNNREKMSGKFTVRRRRGEKERLGIISVKKVNFLSRREDNFDCSIVVP